MKELHEMTPDEVLDELAQGPLFDDIQRRFGFSTAMARFIREDPRAAALVVECTTHLQQKLMELLGEVEPPEEEILRIVREARRPAYFIRLMNAHVTAVAEMERQHAEEHGDDTPEPPE